VNPAARPGFKQDGPSASCRRPVTGVRSWYWAIGFHTGRCDFEGPSYFFLAVFFLAAFFFAGFLAAFFAAFAMSHSS
jgi:hypothetical protein